MCTNGDHTHAHTGHMSMSLNQPTRKFSLFVSNKLALFNSIPTFVLLASVDGYVGSDVLATADQASLAGQLS